MGLAPRKQGSVWLSVATSRGTEEARLSPTWKTPQRLVMDSAYPTGEPKSRSWPWVLPQPGFSGTSLVSAVRSEVLG